MRGRIHGSCRDDDVDYAILGLDLLETHGFCFSTEQVGDLWLLRLPYLQTFTAERAAYRNLANGLKPPLTATYDNSCQEWIGALIRADIYGWTCPGGPRRAAALARRDAVLSHTGNGVQNTVPLRDVGAAGSAVSLFRSMGGTNGVSVLGAVLALQVQDQMTHRRRRTPAVHGPHHQPRPGGQRHPPGPGSTPTPISSPPGPAPRTCAGWATEARVLQADMCLTRHTKAHPWGWALVFGCGIGQFWQQPQLDGVASTVGGGGRRRATRSRTVSVG